MDYKVDDVSLIGRTADAVELPHPDEIAPNGSNLDLAWEWNHTPDNRYWSLTDREGWLRLTAGKVVTGAYAHRDSGGELTWLEGARNTLSQRSFGPRQSAETKLDFSGMNDGEVAGLAAFGQDFSYVAVKRVNGANTVGVVHRGRPFTASIDQAAIERFLHGARLHQWTRTNAANQQFQFVDAGGGYYKIKARHSGKVLDVSSWSTADGAAIHQWTDHGGANQQFRLADSDSGYVRLINRNSGKAVEVQNAATDDGATVVQYSDWGGSNQQWQLVR
jgi:beta-xylosidase